LSAGVHRPQPEIECQRECRALDSDDLVENLEGLKLHLLPRAFQLAGQLLDLSGKPWTARNLASHLPAPQQSGGQHGIKVQHAHGVAR
jgi:hypothetical protein